MVFADSFVVVKSRLVDQFDEMHPEGADYVIVPAFHDPQNHLAANWLRQQSET